MRFFKKLTYQMKLKNPIFLFLALFLTNIPIAFGSEYKSNFDKNNANIDDFEKIYNNNSILFSEYDNYENQVRTFLGIYSLPLEKSYYPDLSIINYSDYVREIYKTKLNEMTINKNNYIIE